MVNLFFLRHELEAILQSQGPGFIFHVMLLLVVRPQVALVLVIGPGAPVLAGVDIHLEMHVVQVYEHRRRVDVPSSATWVRALKGQLVLRSVHLPGGRFHRKFLT